MNIFFYLIPKEKVQYVTESFTIRQALEKMSYHKYSEIPIINDDGKYIGSLREGDILWYIKEKYHLDLSKAENKTIKMLKRNRSAKPIRVDANIEDLLDMAINQNFIPVLDDRDLFIGIVTRKDIMKQLVKNKEENK